MGLWPLPEKSSMALYYDLPVYKDVYRLILTIFEYTKDFPREYKYTLGPVSYTHLTLPTNREV